MNASARALDRSAPPNAFKSVAELREEKIRRRRKQCKTLPNARTFTAASPHRSSPPGARRPPVDQALERRTRRRPDHPPAASQRPALFRNQHSVPVGCPPLQQDFAAPIWMTYRQAAELNAHVRKGEKGSLVVYANTITRTEHDDETGEDIEREIPYMKGYTVFNVEQIDGLPEIYYAKAVPTLDPVARIERAEAFFAATHATIKHGGNRAYYAQELDYVQMPPFEAFRDAESYYATLAHELTHWTKHPSAPRPRPWPQELGR